MSSRRNALLIVGIACLVFLTNLGGPKLWDRDEPRNAGCAREMLERGDWVVPWFNDELRTHKPVLLYWMMMASYSLFGVSEFSARLPSALLAVGTVILTWSVARRFFGDTVAVWSGVILSTFAMFPVVARAATPDSTLIFFTTAAIVAFAHFQSSVNQTNPAAVFRFLTWRQSIVVYSCMGFAVLAKGPVGLVLPTAVIGMFCLIKRMEKRPELPNANGRERIARMLTVFHPRHFLATCWAMRPLTAVIVALLIAGPWYLWVGLRTDGVWLQEFFGEHNFGRATRSLEGHGGSPLIYYPLAILICCFPWSVFTIPTFLTTTAAIRNQEGGVNAGQRDLTILSACWIGVYVILFSLAKTKLPSYIAPCYPAIAILLAVYVARIFDEATEQLTTKRWWTAGLGIATASGLALAVGLTIALRDAFPNQHGILWLAAIGAIPAIGAAVGLWAESGLRSRYSTVAYGVAAVAFAVVLHAVATNVVSDRQQYTSILLDDQEISDGGMLACFDRLEPSWVFYSGSPVKQFDRDSISQALEFLGGSDTARMIVPRSALEDRRLFEGCVIVDECEYFLRKDQLCLVKAADPERNAEWTARNAGDSLD